MHVGQTILAKLKLAGSDLAEGFETPKSSDPSVVVLARCLFIHTRSDTPESMRYAYYRAQKAGSADLVAQQANCAPVCRSSKMYRVHVDVT